MEPQRILKIFVRHLSLTTAFCLIPYTLYLRPSNPRSTTGSSKWRLIKLFEASKVSSWNILRMFCVLDLLFAFLCSLFFIHGSPFKFNLFLQSLAPYNDFVFPQLVFESVIYCWKMGPIRRALMDNSICYEELLL